MTPVTVPIGSWLLSWTPAPPPAACVDPAQPCGNHLRRQVLSVAEHHPSHDAARILAVAHVGELHPNADSLPDEIPGPDRAVLFRLTLATYFRGIDAIDSDGGSDRHAGPGRCVYGQGVALVDADDAGIDGGRDRRPLKSFSTVSGRSRRFEIGRRGAGLNQDRSFADD